MHPAAGEVLHFSEDPDIRRFEPHVAVTAQQPEAYVWAVNADRAPDYWFPRQCPRAMAWAAGWTTAADRDRILGPGGGTRVHAIEYGWHRWVHRSRSVTCSGGTNRRASSCGYCRISGRSGTP